MADENALKNATKICSSLEIVDILLSRVDELFCRVYSGGRKQVFIMYAQRLGAVIYNERATGIGAGIKRYESF